MKVQLTLSPEQLAIIAKALCYFRSARTALYYNDPIWKELGIIIDLAELIEQGAFQPLLPAIRAASEPASYRIINQ